MKAKNLVYWCGLLVLLLGTVLTAAGAGPVTQTLVPAADKVASLSQAGMPDQARICIDLMCPDGTPRDEFCRCRPRACIDQMCPDGTPRDEFCRCQPRACITQICPDGSPRDEFCRCPIGTGSNSTPVLEIDTSPWTVANSWTAGISQQARICIDQICPDGTPRDEFCRCRPVVCTSQGCPGGTLW